MMNSNDYDKHGYGQQAQFYADDEQAKHAEDLRQELMAKTASADLTSSMKNRVEGTEMSWPPQILEALLAEHPYLADFEPRIEMVRADSEEGYALGYAMFGEDQQEVKIPVIIRGRDILPFAAFAFEDKLLPLTEDRVLDVMTTQAATGATPRNDRAVEDYIRDLDIQPPDHTQYMGNRYVSSKLASGGLHKTALGRLGKGLLAGAGVLGAGAVGAGLYGAGHRSGAQNMQRLQQQRWAPDNDVELVNLVLMEQADNLYGKDLSELEDEEWETAYTAAMDDPQIKGLFEKQAVDWKRLGIGAAMGAGAIGTGMGLGSIIDKHERQALAREEREERLAWHRDNPTKQVEQFTPEEYQQRTAFASDNLDLVKSLMEEKAQEAHGAGLEDLNKGQYHEAYNAAMKDPRASWQGAASAKQAAARANAFSAKLSSVSPQHLQQLKDAASDLGLDKVSSFLAEREQYMTVRDPVALLPDMPITDAAKTAMIKMAGAQVFDCPEGRGIYAQVPDTFMFSKTGGSGYMLDYASSNQLTTCAESVPEPAPVVYQLLNDHPDVLNKLGSEGYAVFGGPDPQLDMLEQSSPKPITVQGTYRVYSAQGEPLTGNVFPRVVDFSGVELGLQLFTNGVQAAVEPQIVGELIEPGTAPQLATQPAGESVFAYQDLEGNWLVTVPFSVRGEVATNYGPGLEVETYLMDSLKLVITSSTDKPFEIDPENATWYIPAGWRLVNVGEPNKRVQLQTTPTGYQAMDGQAQKMAAEVRSTDGQDFTIKTAFATQDFIPRAHAELVLTQMGARNPQGILKHAAFTGKVVLVGNLPEQATTSQYAPLIKHAHLVCSQLRPPAHELVKFAAWALAYPDVMYKQEKVASVDEETVDSVLSLGFVNPENTKNYLESVTELEEAQSVLSNLVIASQMGYSEIPMQSALGALNNVEQVLVAMRRLIANPERAEEGQ